MIPTLTLIYDRKKVANRNKQGIVELKLTSGSQRKYISTGVKLYPKEWLDGSVVGREDFHDLNCQLQTFKKKCSEIITRMMDSGKIDINAVPSILRQELTEQNTFLDYAKEHAQRRYKKITEGTRKHYDVLFKFLEEWRGIVYFSDVTEKNILKMDDVLQERGLKECSRWNYHKLIKTFVIQAVEDGLIKHNPYLRVDIKRGNEGGLTRFLTPQEFHKIETCILPSDSLRKVRDLFVFQTYTCLSYSDLAKFDSKDCVIMDGQMVYKAKRQKTKQEFTIVLLRPAIDILEKYNGKLPIISNVKYNAYIKIVASYAGIHKPVSTHWARHTGATLLLNEGKVPIHIIQHILGHSSIRETEKTYAKLMDNTIIETMVNYQNGLK